MSGRAFEQPVDVDDLPRVALVIATQGDYAQARMLLEQALIIR